MQCFIYKSSKKDDLYLYLSNKEDFSVLPEALKHSLGRVQFVMELALTPDRKLAREDAAKVIEALQTRGFFIQLPPAQTLSESGLGVRPLH